MSTHGRFASPFPPFFSFRLMQPDVGAQEPDATADAYYYVEADDG